VMEFSKWPRPLYQKWAIYYTPVDQVKVNLYIYCFKCIESVGSLSVDQSGLIVTGFFPLLFYFFFIYNFTKFYFVRI